MYVDPNCEQSDMVGKSYEIVEPMRVRCCSEIIQPGAIASVRYNTSKKIVLIKIKHGYHKVKMSTLRRCGKEIKDE